ILLVLIFAASAADGAEDSTKTFATPDEAVSALAAAAKSQDQGALRAIFGPTFEGMENPDQIQATNECLAFASAFDQSSHRTQESDSKMVLEVGTNSWPFPIPIVKEAGRWHFDTSAGEDELLNRRVGRNELATLKVMRAYVDAQREYASRDRDGDDVLEYAQR